jgi:hypothetical protein
MSTLLEIAAASRAQFRRDQSIPPQAAVIAEFANANDARDFALSKGRCYYVCAGINLPFAVRYLA